MALCIKDATAMASCSSDASTWSEVASPSTASTTASNSDIARLDSLEDSTLTFSMQHEVDQPSAALRTGIVLEIAKLLLSSVPARVATTNELVAEALLRAKARPSGAPRAEAAQEAPEKKHCNPGSQGHPQLCMRPCIYYLTGHCENGETCEYCHLAHPKRPVHLDKRHRETLRGMTLQETAALVLPVVRAKVQALDASAPTMALTDEFAAFYGVPTSIVEPVTVNRNQRMLVHTLQSMSLRTLLTTLSRMLSVPCADAEQLIEALLQHIRGIVATVGTN